MLAVITKEIFCNIRLDLRNYDGESLLYTTNPLQRQEIHFIIIFLAHIVK